MRASATQQSMRHYPGFLIAMCVAALGGLSATGTVFAQRHSGGSSPPTAPRRPMATMPAAEQPVVAVSSGLGAIQYVAVNYGVPAPQSLTRQLEADDDRTRAAALSAVGAPGQYMQRGHIPLPHSVELNFVALGNTNDLDAVLTVELDQHLVSAILMPEDGNWRRIATVLYATPFSDPRTTPATFLQLSRSLLQPERYRAIYHATSYGPNGDFTENEAHLRVLNNHAVVTISFASSSRTCGATTPHSKLACEVMRRWLQPDPTDEHRFTLVTGTGKLSSREAADQLASSSMYQMAHLRAFSCQAFFYSDALQHYEPTANPVPCEAGR